MYGGTINGNGHSDSKPTNGSVNNAEVLLNQLVENSIRIDRWMTQMYGDKRRNIERECGYVETGMISAFDYQNLWNRDPVAGRVVNVFPMECWQQPPQLIEDEDVENITDFEAAWQEVGKNIITEGLDGWYRDDQVNSLWTYLERADIYSGIGSYGVMLIGIDDGLELKEPAKLNAKSGRKLNFIRVLSECEARVSRFDTDPNSARYGKPEMYSVLTGLPTLGVNGEYVGATTGVIQTETKEVHWTRIVHVVDNPYGSEVGGIPRMQQPYNRLYDLHKMYGGSTEMYWQGAFPGISFETHPQLGGDVAIDRTAMRSQLVNYTQGLQRYLTMPGMTAKTLSPTVVDPSANIDKLIEAICILTGIPKRIFMGSERGELASTTDLKSWYNRCRHRQTSYITPFLIARFVDRLILLGVLPIPKDGYGINWPDLAAASDLEKAKIGLSRTQAIVSYVSGGGYQLVDPKDWWTRVMSYDDSDAKQILEDTQDNMEQMQEANLEQRTQPPEPPQQGNNTVGNEEFNYGSPTYEEDTDADYDNLIENGGPGSGPHKVTAYHGSDVKFNQFDDSKLGSRTDPGFFGVGHYLVDDKDNAQRWGKHVITAEVTLNNPLHVNGITDFVEKVGQKKTNSKEEYAAEMKRVTDNLKKQGYDGVVYHRSNGVKQYIAFSGGSVKVNNTDPGHKGRPGKRGGSSKQSEISNPSIVELDTLLLKHKRVNGLVDLQGNVTVWGGKGAAVTKAKELGEYQFKYGITVTLASAFGKESTLWDIYNFTTGSLTKGGNKTIHKARKLLLRESKVDNTWSDEARRKSVESRKGKKLPHDIFNVGVGRVHQNPSKSNIDKLFSKETALRGLGDGGGNLWVWSAEDLTHEDVADHLGLDYQKLYDSYDKHHFFITKPSDVTQTIKEIKRHRKVNNTWSDKAREASAESRKAKAKLLESAATEAGATANRIDTHKAHTEAANWYAMATEATKEVDSLDHKARALFNKHLYHKDQADKIKSGYGSNKERQAIADRKATAATEAAMQTKNPLKAAKLHTVAAKANTEAGHTEQAKLHADKARQLSERVVKADSTSQRQAKLDKAAAKATKLADKTSGAVASSVGVSSTTTRGHKSFGKLAITPEGMANGHKQAAKAHDKAAIEQAKAGNLEQANYHIEQAAKHRKAASEVNNTVENAKFSSTQLTVTDPKVIAAVKELQGMINSSDIVELEDRPHITVLYGLHTNDPEDVAKWVSNSGPIMVRVDRLEVFTDNPEFDVLKFTIDSNSLRNLNRNLSMLDNTNNYSYNPHMTVAYVSKGTGSIYTALPNKLLNDRLLFKSLTFSDTDNQQTELPLTQL